MKDKTTLDQSLPFKSLINFGKVFEFWESMAKEGDGAERVRAEYILKRLEPHTQLREPFSDVEILEEYKNEIDLLLSCFFPKALQLNEIKAATLPFANVLFSETERFANIIKNAGEEAKIEFRNLDDQYYVTAAFILKVVYGAKVNISRPMIFDLWDESSGIYRAYRGFFNADFTELRKTDRSPDLTEEQIQSLLDNVHDVEKWRTLIPPDSFEMHGFGLLTIFDITADDALSDLKLNLIDQDALRNEEKLRDLEISLRKLLSIRDLKLGLSMIQGKRIRTLGEKVCQSILLAGEKTIERQNLFCDHSEHHLLKLREPLVISNFEDIDTSQSQFLKSVCSHGIKSYAVNPLVYQDKVIGFLELGSGQPYVLNSTVTERIEEVVPLFSAALHRTVDDYMTNLEAIIKEKCTAIHPAVEWRFMEAAARVYESGRPKSEVEMEEIVFEEVHPLFGQTDIRGSSTYRDRGIQQDLLTQLKLGRDVLDAALEEENLILYQQLISAIHDREKSIQKRLNAGDETATLDFLKFEVEALFDHLKSREIATTEIEAYFSRIDPKINMVYEGRRDYEETVNLINELVSTYIENSQLAAQKMFPHYFEKYKTDGVEYNMYIGDSLVENQGFHEMYLKNLRLWQLIMTCEIENLLHDEESNFKVPLKVASLILVQNKSLDIKFRFDEKQFDVDGAYNARYEIIKKRIDKASLRGKKERLTMPGKIAIVYSSEDERREYQEYLQYLISKEYIKPEVEFVELEELQGAAGLRAMRVSVNFEKDTSETQLSKQVAELIEELN